VAVVGGSGAVLSDGILQRCATGEMKETVTCGPGVFKIQYKFQIRSNFDSIQKLGSKAPNIQVRIWGDRI
jgi:hypothetical protein